MFKFYKLLIFFFKKKHIFDDYINIAHIFNIISAIYDWIFLKFDESFELTFFMF